MASIEQIKAHFNPDSMLLNVDTLKIKKPLDSDSLAYLKNKNITFVWVNSNELKICEYKPKKYGEILSQLTGCYNPFELYKLFSNNNIPIDDYTAIKLVYKDKSEYIYVPESQCYNNNVKHLYSLIKCKFSLKKKECPICLNLIKNDCFKIRTVECKHTFHKKCLNRWIKQNENCPLCRTKLDVRLIK